MVESQIVQAVETLTLMLIITSFIVMTSLAIRAKSIKSLQVQLFIFTLILVAAEIPHILDTLALIDTTPYHLQGLGIHAASMIILALFIGYRWHGFLKG